MSKKNILDVSMVCGLLLLFMSTTIAEGFGRDTVSPMTQHPATLKIEIAPVLEPEGTVKNGQEFTVNTAIRNIGSEDRILHIWICSYPDHWKTDNSLIVIKPAECTKNFLKDFLLKPGEAYKRELSVRIAAPAQEAMVNSVTFRLAFQSWITGEDGFPREEAVPPVWGNTVMIKLKD